jgi:hypothetical protein
VLLCHVLTATVTTSHATMEGDNGSQHGLHPCATVDRSKQLHQPMGLHLHHHSSRWHMRTTHVMAAAAAFQLRQHVPALPSAITGMVASMLGLAGKVPGGYKATHPLAREHCSKGQTPPKRQQQINHC